MQKMRQWGSSHRSLNLLKSIVLRYLPSFAGTNHFNYDIAKPKQWPSFETNLQPDPEESKADEVDFDGPTQPKEKFFAHLVKS